MWRQGDHFLAFPSTPLFGCILVAALTAFFFCIVETVFFFSACGPVASLMRYSFWSASLKSPKAALSSSEASRHSMEMLLLNVVPFLHSLIAWVPSSLLARVLPQAISDQTNNGKRHRPHLNVLYLVVGFSFLATALAFGTKTALVDEALRLTITADIFGLPDPCCRLVRSIGSLSFVGRLAADRPGELDEPPSPVSEVEGVPLSLSPRSALNFLGRIDTRILAASASVIGC
jgi:hypothetical protein